MSPNHKSGRAMPSPRPRRLTQTSKIRNTTRPIQPITLLVTRPGHTSKYLFHVSSCPYMTWNAQAHYSSRLSSSMSTPITTPFIRVLFTFRPLLVSPYHSTGQAMPSPRPRHLTRPSSTRITTRHTQPITLLLTRTGHPSKY